MVTAQLRVPRLVRQREPGLIIRFVERLSLASPLRFIDSDDVAFCDGAFVILPKHNGPPGRAIIPMNRLGFGCEIVCESGISKVPLLLSIIHLVLYSVGALALHASAFTFDGQGILATGWAKGGKTEMLLAYMAQGAKFIGDDWIYVDPNRGYVYGTDRPFSVWSWCLDDLPEFRHKIGARRRMRLAAQSSISKWLDKAAYQGAGNGGTARKVAGKVGNAVQSRMRVNLEPKEFFGPDACSFSGTIHKVYLVGSYDSPDIDVHPIGPREVVQRMVYSLQYERKELMSYYTKFRFAFPAMRSALIEGAADIERDLLSVFLATRGTYTLLHPYPLPIRRLFDSTQSTLEPDE